MEQEIYQLENLLKMNNLGFAGSLLHCLAANNHPHLLDETIKSIMKISEAQNASK